MAFKIKYIWFVLSFSLFINNLLQLHVFYISGNILTGTAQEFKRKFEAPILRGRDSTASDSEHTKGQEKLQEVGVGTRALLSKLYLPAKECRLEIGSACLLINMSDVGAYFILVDCQWILEIRPVHSLFTHLISDVCLHCSLFFVHSYQASTVCFTMESQSCCR